MTQKEKNAMAREAFEYWEHEYNRSKEPITIIDPYGEYSALANGRSVSITDETRRESYDAVKEDAAHRRRVVYEILKERGGMTAREVSAELHQRGITATDERNFAAPRLTELKEAGKIEATGKKICEYTGRSVAIWAVKEVRK